MGFLFHLKKGKISHRKRLERFSSSSLRLVWLERRTRKVRPLDFSRTPRPGRCIIPEDRRKEFLGGKIFPIPEGTLEADKNKEEMKT